MTSIEKFPVRNRWTGEVQFTAEISTTPDMMPSMKLGLAVKWAVKNKADLSRADLSGAYLSGAKGSELAIARTRILPEGSLIGWKKCQSGVIVKLRIPEEAKRSHAFGRKCRAEYADVMEVIGAEVGISDHDRMTEYRAGERVTCDKWIDDWQEECAGGIHFYITREEAEAH